MTYKKEGSLPLISIQILNWNRAIETVRAINSALEQTYPNKEIIIVDNGSTDNSIELISSSFPEITLIKLDRNYGCPGGRNRGIEFCNGEFIFYLDNDGVLHKDALMYAFDSICQDDNIAVVTGRVMDFKTTKEIDTTFKVNNSISFVTYNFQGGVCLHRKNIYTKIGFYPEHFIYGAEELYLAYRITEHKLKVVKNDSVILWHKASEIARNRRQETISSYYNKLYVSVNLFPVFFAFIFVVFFPFRYLIHSYREGFFLPFLKSIPFNFIKTILMAMSSRRNPVSFNTYLRVSNSAKKKNV